ncbi:Uncharacterised protein [Chlamydia trachomatis]|nr:Uncharacterised protein [Chlamydia trachomatis]
MDSEEGEETPPDSSPDEDAVSDTSSPIPESVSERVISSAPLPTAAVVVGSSSPAPVFPDNFVS